MMADQQPVQTPQQTPPTQTPNQPPQKPGGYGKRPLWQWVLIYLVVGGIIYFVVYYLFMRGNGGGVY